jgi:hypothetical protein
MRKRVAFFLAVSAIALLGGASLVLSQEAKIDPDVYKQIRYRYIGSVGESRNFGGEHSGKREHLLRWRGVGGNF